MFAAVSSVRRRVICRPDLDDKILKCYVRDQLLLRTRQRYSISAKCVELAHLAKKTHFYPNEANLSVFGPKIPQKRLDRNQS